MTRCTHCGGSVLTDYYGPVCMSCGRRPEGADPGPGPEAASQLLHVKGAEHHTKGAGATS